MDLWLKPMFQQRYHFAIIVSEEAVPGVQAQLERQKDPAFPNFSFLPTSVGRQPQCAHSASNPRQTSPQYPERILPELELPPQLPKCFQVLQAEVPLLARVLYGSEPLEGLPLSKPLAEHRRFSPPLVPELGPQIRSLTFLDLPDPAQVVT